MTAEDAEKNYFVSSCFGDFLVLWFDDIARAYTIKILPQSPSEATNLCPSN